MHFEKRVPILTGLGFEPSRLPVLKNYIDLLWQSNEELNLISRKMTYEELIDNHVIDCLLPLAHFPRPENQPVKRVADFGAGGGLPGVIYALQFPQTAFHLYEKSPKKQEFLKRCQALAPNIEILGDIPLALPGIELIIARGFKPLDVILDMSRHYYSQGGRYFLLKARREKIDEEILLAKKKFKDLSVTIETLTSPVLEVERHLLRIGDGES